jgi:hypothetical protein
MNVTQLEAAATLDASATNITSETSWAAVTVPMHLLSPGNVVEVQGTITWTATVSTDRWITRFRFGAVDGELIGETDAHDVADGDELVIQGRLIILSDGAACGYVNVTGRGTTNPVLTTPLTSTRFGTAAGSDLTLRVTAECSTQNANVGVVHNLRAEVLAPAA